MTAKGINGLEGRESEELVDHAEAKGTDYGHEVRHLSLDEDVGGVEGNGVDTTYLLSDHDSGSSEVTATNARDGEELQWV